MARLSQRIVGSTLWSTPMRRIRSGCCARAASGHVASAPPRAASNSRRPMVTVMRPSRARCVEGRIPRHGRAVLPCKEGQDAGCFHLCRRLQLHYSRRPAPRERRHRGLACRSIAVRRRVTHSLRRQPPEGRLDIGAADRRRARSGFKHGSCCACHRLKSVAQVRPTPSLTEQRYYTERLWVLTLSRAAYLQSSERL